VGKLAGQGDIPVAGDRAAHIGQRLPAQFLDLGDLAEGTCRVGRVRPSIMSMVVVLPAPFGPSRATVSPGAMTRSSDRTARTAP
jgi:hypothetical protein